MKNSRVLSVLLLFLCAGLAQAELASYSYSGDPITASLVLPQAIEPNSQYSVDLFNPSGATWSVGDGVQTINQNSSDAAGYFVLYTDNRGNIGNWLIAVGEYPYSGSSHAFAINSWGPGTPCSWSGEAYYGTPVANGCPMDFFIQTSYGQDGSFDGNSFEFASQGAWTDNAATPEPGGAGMLAIGAVLLSGMWILGKNRRGA